jgi:2-polyprenyl-6-methoxyphenol hydroxylase-like FAD-dependent oxidoreductase
MARVLILGGGICGLGTAMLLARDGHEVTVLERDPDEPPASAADAWDIWARKGVAQFRQPHNFMPGARHLLERELPDVQELLRRSGAAKLDFVNPLPPFFVDRSPRPVDDALWTYTARRPVLDWVFATAASREARVTVRRGVRVKELLPGTQTAPGVPHVVGARTTAGEELGADLVVDAMGRLSRSPDWLVALGARRAYEEVADCGFTYYTRYFRGTEPQRLGPVFLVLGTIGILTLPGDHGTWSVTLMTASGDLPLKALRDPATWTKVVAACPLQAHWLDGEPLGDIHAMSGIVDRYRRFVVDGFPVATGLVAVADAWACTNPSAGRGLTVGLLHAVQLRDAVRTAGGDPGTLVRRFDELTETHVTPWYRAQIAMDRARYAQIAVLQEGREPPPPTEDLARRTMALFTAMIADPDLFRATLEYVGTVTPIQDVLARADVARKVADAADPPPMPPLGPDRTQLLALVA